MKESFQAYLGDKNRDFEKHFRNLNHHIRDEDVHELRVRIKKLRAAYHFLESRKILTSTDTKYKSEMRKLYRSAGHYRESSIFIELTNKYNSQTPYADDFTFLEDFLRERKDKCSVQLAIAVNNFNFNKHIEFSGRLHLKVNSLPNERIPTALVKYLKKLRKQCEKMLITKGTEWHELRKLLKHIIYLYPVAADQPDETFLNYLKNTADRLGYWQDCYSYHNYLSEYVIYHEVFEHEKRLLVRDLVAWLKNEANHQVKGMKKSLRMELYKIQKIDNKT